MNLREKGRPGNWFYSGNPAASGKDWVRWRVGDVRDDDQLVSDEEIAAALSDASDNKTLAAAMIAERIAADFSRDAQVSISDGSGAARSYTYDQRAKAYAALAKQIRGELASGASLAAMFPAPYCGGISQADKDAREANTDRVEPAFTVDMQDYV